jgi:hypothetical protein
MIYHFSNVLMNDFSGMRRDVMAEVSSREFYRTGFYPDVVQVLLVIQPTVFNLF